MTHKCENCGTIFERQLRVARFCTHACYACTLVGMKLSKDTRSKMSEAKQGYMPVNIFQSGPAHPFWVQDRRAVAISETPEYRDLRLGVLKRDHYTCQQCGRRGQSGDRPVLDMHHIKSQREHPELALVKANCITLCRKCHRETGSYLNRWRN